MPLAPRHLGLKRTYDLGSVLLHEYPDFIHTIYPEDGSENVFAPVASPEFLAAVHEMGYSDPMRYAVEHELAHHIGALERGLAHSPIVWDAAHSVPMSLDEPDRAAEEHLTNRLQRYMNMGDEDPHGCLQAAYGDRLPEVAARLIYTARPWLTHAPSA